MCKKPFIAVLTVSKKTKRNRTGNIQATCGTETKVLHFKGSGEGFHFQWHRHNKIPFNFKFFCLLKKRGGGKSCTVRCGEGTACTREGCHTELLSPSPLGMNPSSSCKSCKSEGTDPTSSSWASLDLPHVQPFVTGCREN